MPSPSTPDLRPGDLVAVTLSPGRDWAGIVGKVWEAGAALFPVDHRLPTSMSRDLMDRAVPTIVVDADGWHRPGAGRPVGDGVALVVHTSGTGGIPKLVQFDRPAIDAAVASSTLALEASPQDRWLCCLPLAHVGGLLVLLRSILLGAPVIVHPGFDPEAVAAEADSAFVSIVPTMLVRLLEADADLSHFRAILVGGAAVPAWLVDRARAEGANVIETYGLTESFGGVVYDGRPLLGTEARIDGGGGIQLRGPTLMRGYLDDGEATARAFTDGGWLRAGDAGWIDDQGRLRVAGRLDDLINTGGEKVWPAEVEAILQDHPGVAEVAIVGRPDPEWGQCVVAYVVPADPTAPPSLEALRDHVALSLPRHSAPRQLVLVPEGLPRTASGKVRRAALA
ncbi:MAG TPA: fatty acid--CoA ligase family protein [Actinomycetota bacterium]|nr:fatty acid--CoA ligase family protein [Actinomycetota bacterium]